MRKILTIFVLGLSFSLAAEMNGEANALAPLLHSHNLNSFAMDNQEIWKDINDFNGYYQVSNLGNVKSLKRFVTKITHKNPTIIKERILKPGVNTNGYYIVGLRKSEIRITAKVHKLVAMAFLNHMPSGFDLVINHIDLNKKNNNANNLEIISQRENANKKHIPHSSQYTGVSWNKHNKKWCAFIQINGKNKNIGSFENEYDAHLAYQNKLKEING